MLKQHLMTSTMLGSPWLMSWIIPTGRDREPFRTTLANLFMGSKP